MIILLPNGVRVQSMTMLHYVVSGSTITFTLSDSSTVAYTATSASQATKIAKTIDAFSVDNLGFCDMSSNSFT